MRRDALPSLGTRQQVAAWRVEARRPQARGDGSGPGGSAASVVVDAWVCVTPSHPRGIHGDQRTRVKESPPSLVSLPPSFLDILLQRRLSLRHGSAGPSARCSELLLLSENRRLGQLPCPDQTTPTFPPRPLAMPPHPNSRVPQLALGTL